MKGQRAKEDCLESHNGGDSLQEEGREDTALFAEGHLAEVKKVRKIAGLRF